MKEELEPTIKDKVCGWIKWAQQEQTLEAVLEATKSIINLVDKELPEKIKYTGDEILGIKIAISEHLVAKGFGIHSIKEIDAYNKAIDDMRAKLKGVSNGDI